MDVFKSKEVYKHVIANGEHKLIPVSGMYVASEYRAPYFIDNIMMLTQINGQTEAAVFEYSESEESQNEECFGYCIITYGEPGINEYSRDSAYSYPGLEGTVTCDIDITVSAANVTEYTKQYASTYEAPITHMDVNVTNVGVTMVNTLPQDLNTFDSAIKLVSITGQPADII